MRIIRLPGRLRRARVLLVLSLLLCTRPLAAAAPEPGVDGNLLNMPVVLVFDTAFRIDWQIVNTNGLIDLLLHDYEELGAVDTSGAPSYFGDVLNLPRLNVDGVSWWGEFYLDSEQPVIFRLHAAGANDPGSSGVQGKWRITEETDARDCGEGELIDIYSLQVRQQGSDLTVITAVGSFEAVLEGTSLSWSGSYGEDGGTVTISVQVEFADSLDSLAGSSQWSWSGGGDSCDGSSVFTGVLLHN